MADMSGWEGKDDLDLDAQDLADMAEAGTPVEIVGAPAGAFVVRVVPTLVPWVSTSTPASSFVHPYRHGDPVLREVARSLARLATDVGELKNSVRWIAWTVPVIVGVGMTVIGIIVGLK